ncbi:MAG TPA: RidA family protein [Thermoanaerobaculia bacterium]
MTHAAWKPVESDAPPAKGAYSRAARAGNLVFVSGQVPRSFETGALLGETLAEQTRGAVANLRRVLESAGLGLSDIVSVTAYLADIAAWDEFDRVYRELVPQPYPTRTTLGANLHGVLVEINAIAVAR